MTDTPPIGGQEGRWTEVEAAFSAVVDTPPESRESLLASLCTDELVLAEVRRLLARHDSLSTSRSEADGFLRCLDGARAAALLDDGRDPETIGRYEILGRLGRGATGVVYLARDPSLRRRVALKLLAPHLSGRPDAVRRFAEEARTASALDHPHIATIHEIDRTDDGRLFITMTYYEGETLRARLARGPLSVDEAVRYASQLADALGAAHARGIVHRDVKPENVVLTARGVRLVDFGIAKVSGQDGHRAAVPAGTVAYMSPEQTRGEDVGPPVDLWALGVVLYEMLAGVRPFRGESTDPLIAAIRGEAPAPLRSLRADVPVRVARAVERCLEKDCTARYPSAEAVLADLAAAPAGLSGGRRVAVATGLLAFLSMAALAGRSWHPASEPVGTSTPMSTIAVLPFANLSPDAEPGHVTDGMTNALVEALSRMPDIRVVGPVPTSDASRGQSDLRKIGARLRAASVLQGTVQRAGDRVRVSARLISAADSSTVWSEEFDRDAGEVLSLQDEVSRALVTALQRRMGGSLSPRSAQPTGDPLAYDLYLRGRFRLQRRTPADLEEAAILFREALARDSSFARAYVGLADVYMAVQAARPADRYERAKPLVARALALDSNLAPAHKAAGWMTMWYDRDWAAAERHYQRALELDPSDVSAYHGYAALLSATGRSKESLAMTRHAVVLDPVGIYTMMHIGLHLYWDRRYEEAIAVLRRALEADSSFGRTHAVLGRALLGAGRHEEAIVELRHDGFQYAALEPRALLAYALGIAGQTEEARAIQAEYEARARGTYVSPLNLVAIHLGLGETGQALDWLEKVPDDRGVMIFPLSDPIYDVLHGMPRFERVLERLNLRHNL